MTVTEALHMLQLESGASEKQVRSRLFQEYQRLTAQLSQLDDERQRPLLEAKLTRLNQARDLLLGGSLPNHPTLVSQEELPTDIAVLLCRQGNHEGIYTQRMQNHDIIIGFDQEFAARKYAQKLVKKGLPKPKLEWFATEEILEFCHDNGYGLTVIPSDAPIEPPENDAASLEDWDPSRS